MDAADLVAAQRRHIATAQVGSSAKQRAIVRSTVRGIERRLGQLRPDSWGAAQQQATLVLIGQAVQQMNVTQIGALSGDLGKVMRMSQRDAAKYLGTLDAKFHGAARPLSFNSLSWWDQHRTQFGQVRLRQFSRSFARYGAGAVQEIEGIIGRTVLMGETWDKARDEVWRATRGVVGDRQWMVDRIVRTEIAAAYNGTQLAALEAEDDPEDPMFKKLVTIFDEVTGSDSKAVHGQTRRVAEKFVDPIGRRYSAPPNRPHDREIIVGWRSSYDEDFPDYDAATAKEAGLRRTKGPEVEPVTPPPLPPPSPAVEIPQLEAELRNVRMSKAMLGVEAKTMEQALISSRLAVASHQTTEARALALTHNANVEARLVALRTEIADLATKQRSLTGRLSAAKRRAKRAPVPAPTPTPAPPPVPPVETMLVRATTIQPGDIVVDKTGKPRRVEWVKHRRGRGPREIEIKLEGRATTMGVRRAGRVRVSPVGTTKPVPKPTRKVRAAPKPKPKAKKPAERRAKLSETETGEWIDLDGQPLLVESTRTMDDMVILEVRLTPKSKPITLQVPDDTVKVTTARPVDLPADEIEAAMEAARWPERVRARISRLQAQVRQARIKAAYSREAADKALVERLETEFARVQSQRKVAEEAARQVAKDALDALPDDALMARTTRIAEAPRKAKATTADGLRKEVKGSADKLSLGRDGEIEAARIVVGEVNQLHDQLRFAPKLDHLQFAKMGRANRAVSGDARLGGTIEAPTFRIRVNTQQLGKVSQGDAVATMQRAHRRIGEKHWSSVAHMDEIAGAKQAHTVRHEMGHIVDFHLRYNSGALGEELMRLWDDALRKVSRSSRMAVSEYAATKNAEMLTECFSLAVIGKWDAIPAELHRPLRLMLLRR